MERLFGRIMELQRKEVPYEEIQQDRRLQEEAQGRQGGRGNEVGRESHIRRRPKSRRVLKESFEAQGAGVRHPGAT